MPKELAGIQAALQGQVGRISRGAPVAAGGELILARNLLPLFYQSRAYQPAWIQEGRKASFLWIIIFPRSKRLPKKWRGW